MDQWEYNLEYVGRLILCMEDLSRWAGSMRRDVRRGVKEGEGRRGWEREGGGGREREGEREGELTNATYRWLKEPVWEFGVWMAPRGVAARAGLGNGIFCCVRSGVGVHVRLPFTSGLRGFTAPDPPSPRGQ